MHLYLRNTRIAGFPYQIDIKHSSSLSIFHLNKVSNCCNSCGHSWKNCILTQLMQPNCNCSKYLSTERDKSGFKFITNLDVVGRCGQMWLMQTQLQLQRVQNLDFANKLQLLTGFKYMLCSAFKNRESFLIRRKTLVFV